MAKTNAKKNNEATTEVTTEVSTEVTTEVSTEAKENAMTNSHHIGRVSKVMIPKDGIGKENRIIFIMDDKCVFTTIDYKTHEINETTSFSLNVYNVVNQVVNYVPEIQLADTLAMGAMVNPMIIALAMTGATIEFDRVFKLASDTRENTNEVYGQDCFVTKITNVKTSINPVSYNMLNHLIMTQPCIKTITTSAAPNPFNITI